MTRYLFCTDITVEFYPRAAGFGRRQRMELIYVIISIIEEGDSMLPKGICEICT